MPRPKKKYPQHEGWQGRPRFTPRTESEIYRHKNSMTLRIGADLIDEIRGMAEESDWTQGELARALILRGLQAVQAGEIEIPEKYNGNPAGSDGNNERDALGRLA